MGLGTLSGGRANEDLMKKKRQQEVEKDEGLVEGPSYGANDPESLMTIKN